MWVLRRSISIMLCRRLTTPYAFRWRQSGRGGAAGVGTARRLRAPGAVREVRRRQLAPLGAKCTS